LNQPLKGADCGEAAPTHRLYFGTIVIQLIFLAGLQLYPHNQIDRNPVIYLVLLDMFVKTKF